MSTSAHDIPERLPVDSEIGRRVFHRMWDMKVTQTQIGQRIGVGQSALSKKLRGDRPWYSSELRDVAAILGVSVGYLFGETDETAPGWSPGPSLPGLDSNQEPIGFQPAGELIYVEFAA
jgi:transcriptional regulator with XRE-family HTH domain